MNSRKMAVDRAFTRLTDCCITSLAWSTPLLIGSPINDGQSAANVLG